MTSGATGTVHALRGSRRPRAAVFLAAGLLLLAAVTGPGIAARLAPLHGVAVAPRAAATDALLVDQEGRPLRLADLRGEPTLLYFGYTRCVDVCPTTLANWKSASRALGTDASRVHFLMVSVDPAYDRPQVLKDYIASFDPRFVGATGARDVIERLIGEYGGYVRDAPTEMAPGEAGLRHSAVSYALDQAGQLAIVFPYGTIGDDLAADLRHLLLE